MESTKELKLLGLRDSVSGLIPSLPTLILPPHNDLPHSCRFKFRACLGKGKRKVWWKYACMVDFIAQHPATLSTYLPHTARASNLFRASHLCVTRAESWDTDKWALGTSLSYFSFFPLSKKKSWGIWILLLSWWLILSSRSCMHVLRSSSFEQGLKFNRAMLTWWRHGHQGQLVVGRGKYFKYESRALYFQILLSCYRSKEKDVRFLLLTSAWKGLSQCCCLSG